MGDYAEDVMRMSRRSGRGTFKPDQVMGQEACVKCGGHKLSATRNRTICDVSGERHILNELRANEENTMFMNEYEVDEILDLTKRRYPQYEPFAQYLHDWKETINNNSDGWAYWKAGRGAADKLCTLLEQVKMAELGRAELPSESLFARAMTPIKAAATRHGLQAPELQDPTSSMSMR